MNEESILSRLRDRGREVPHLRLGPPSEDADLSGADLSSRSTDRYEITEELGRGGAGVVYQGRDVDLGRDVAMKVLREGHLEDPDLIRRFVEEAQIRGQLQHPSFVPVYELGLQADRRPYFTMKLVRGETLAALLERRGNSSADRRRLLTALEQVCQAVAYAHDRGVIHRDLKPANVMIGAFGEVQVVDWGFATVCTDADEQDERADVFALGAMLSEVLTGESSPDCLDDFDADEELVALCRACLSPSPADRPPHSGILAEKLGEYLSAVQAREHQSNLRAIEERARRARAREKAEESRAVAEEQRRKRRQTLALAGGVLLVILALTGGWLWVEEGRAGRVRRASVPVEEAMREASHLAGAGDLNGAVRAAERALQVARTGEAGADLRAGAAELFDELQAEQMSWEADARVLDSLEELRTRWTQGLDFDPLQADAAYAAAFREYGIDIGGLAPDQAAETIRGRKTALELASALGAWARLRLSEEALADRDWRSLLRISELVDPDEERMVIRESTFQLLRLTPAQAGELAVAAKILREAVDDHAGDLWINLDVADFLMRLDPPNLEPALPYLAAAVALRPGRSGLRLRLGDAYQAAGSPYEAARAFESAARLEPDSVDARLGLGKALQKMGDLEGATVAYGEVMALRPGCEEARSRLAEAEEALEDREASAAAYNRLGWILHRYDDLDEACAAHRKAIDLEPDNARHHNDLAGVLSDLGDDDGALESLRKAIGLEPENALWQLSLGRALGGNEDFRGSVEAFRRGLDLDLDRIPPSLLSRYLVRMGEALVELGDFQGAVVAGRRAFDLWPDNPQACHFLEWILSECEDESVRDPETAIRMARRAVRLSGPPWSVSRNRPLLNLGKVLYRAGKYERALSVLRSLRDVKGVVHRLYLGMAYQKLGRTEEARRWYEKAVEAQADDPSPNDHMKRVRAEADEVFGEK